MTRSVAMSRTGPIRPDGTRASPFFQSLQVVNVERPVGLVLPSFNHRGHSLSVPLGFRSAVLGQLLVTDHPVDPQVDHFHIQGVRARTCGLGDIYQEGRLPEDTQVLAIERDMSHDLDLAEIQVEPVRSTEHLGRHAERPGIGGHTGEVLHTGIGVLRPRDQVLEGGFRGCAAVR